jgi:hypothetical protein
MEPAEFALMLLKVLALGFFIAVINSAGAENPLMAMLRLVLITAVIVVLVALVGVVCYVIAGLWRNPLVAVTMIVSGFLVYRYLWARRKCASG